MKYPDNFLYPDQKEITITELEVEAIYALYQAVKVAKPIVHAYGTARDVRDMEMFLERADGVPHPNNLMAALSKHPFVLWEKEKRRAESNSDATE